MKKVLLLALLSNTLGVNAQKKLTVKIESQVLVGEVVEEPTYTKAYQNPPIDREIDKFTGELTISTKQSDVKLLKCINKNKPTVYYLRLESEAATINYGCKGVTVLFTDGTKWIKSSEKVDMNYYGTTTFYATAFISLTPSDIKIFQTKNIASYRLYIYDTDITSEEANGFNKSFNKVVASK